MQHIDYRCEEWIIKRKTLETRGERPRETASTVEVLRKHSREGLWGDVCLHSFPYACAMCSGPFQMLGLKLSRGMYDQGWLPQGLLSSGATDVQVNITM